MSREATLQAKSLSAMQLSKGVKKKEPTYLAALKVDEGLVPSPMEGLPKEI
jgi:hypothetical protein